MCVSALLFFAFIFLDIASGGGRKLDSAILIRLRTPGNLSKPIGPGWMLQSAIDLSALGGFTFIWLFTVVTTGFLALVKCWAALGIFLATIVGASVLNALFKFSFHRDRSMLVPHLAEVSNSSFPSGHAMISAATYMTVGALLAHTQPGAAGAYLSAEPGGRALDPDRPQPALSLGALAIGRAGRLGFRLGLGAAVLDHLLWRRAGRTGRPGVSSGRHRIAPLSVRGALRGGR